MTAMEVFEILLDVLKVFLAITLYLVVVIRIIPVLNGVRKVSNLDLWWFLALIFVQMSIN